MNVREAALRLGVHEESVRTYIRRGLLAARFEGGRYEVTADALVHFLATADETSLCEEPDLLPLPDEAMLTAAQVGRLHGVGVGAVGQWVRKRKLRAYRVGKRYWIRYGDAKRFRPRKRGHPIAGLVKATKGKTEEEAT